MTPARRREALRLGLLVIMLGGLGVAVLRSARELSLQADVEQVCILEEGGDHQAAADAAEPLVAQARGAAAVDLMGCRCAALLALGRGRECLPMVEAVEADGDLTLQAGAAALYVSLDAGEPEAALRWARRLAEQLPPSTLTLNGEVQARLTGEPPEQAAAALAPRFAALPPEQTVHERMLFADRLARAGLVDEALNALEPPPAQDPEGWYLVRHRVLADAGRQAELVESFQRWQAAGGPRGHLMLQYAYILETRGLKDPTRDWVDLYTSAIAAADPTRDRDLLEQAYRRLVGLYAVGGLADLAAATLAEAQAKGLSVSLSTDELARLGDAEPGAGVGRIRFDLAGFQRGDLLLVSPADTAPADSRYEEIALEGPTETVLRDTGETPVRWVWTDAARRPLASGAVWPSAQAPTTIVVPDRGVPGPAPASFTWTPQPGDGRSRLYVIILDCADWRLSRYLQARGELPVLGALEAAGRAGVLTSVPAMTGTAMEKLTRPRVASTFTLMSYAHHMGAELGGLSSIGKNPIDALTWVLPDNPYILDVVGATDKIGANMLFSHGAKVEAGRNAELVGPNSQRRMLEGLTWRRALRPEEATLLPGLNPIPTTVEDIAAEMDIAVDLIGRREIDLLLLRVEPLDLLTHAHYADTARAGRDDATPYLYQVYRYVDQRLGEVANAIDQDDVLVVMSDHGIQASMLHDPEALFIAVGQGIVPGRLDGQPELAGIARALLDRLGVPAPEGWPDTGLSAALRTPPEGEGQPSGERLP